MSSEWEIWKDCAYPGRVVVPGDRGRVVYDFTARDMALLERSGNAKVNDGWNVPLAWEHQDVEPTRARLSQNPDRDFALGVFGRIKRFARTPDGRLKALLAGTDPRDLDQLQKVGFVSPEIQWDWTDTDGRTWPGPSVTHLAATARPVQRHQHPVGTDPDLPHPRLAAGSLERLVRMSLTAGAPAARNAPRVGARLRLSLDHYASPPAGVRPMADSTIPGLPTDKKNPWMRVAEALATIGVKIGDGSNIKDPDHLADLCEVACMNSQAAQPELEDELPPEDEEEGAPPGDMDAPPEGASEPPPPIQMSQQAQAANQKLVGMHRGELLRRAQALATSGRVSPALANDLTARVKKVKLSLTANADLAPTDVGAEIAAYERLDKGSATPLGRRPVDPATGKPLKKGVRMSQQAGKARAVAEVDRSPYQEDGAVDEDAIVREYEANVGRKGFGEDLG